MFERANSDDEGGVERVRTEGEVFEVGKGREDGDEGVERLKRLLEDEG